MSVFGNHTSLWGVGNLFPFAAVQRGGLRLPANPPYALVLPLIFSLIASISAAAQVPEKLGKPVSPSTWEEVLSKNKGTYTLYTFWGVTCEPCIEEMPHLVKVYKQLKPKGLVICSVNTDPKMFFEAASKLLEKLEIPFDRYYKEPGSDVKFRQAIDPDYGANPFAVLYDPDGKKVRTIASAHNEAGWLEILSPYLAENKKEISEPDFQIPPALLEGLPGAFDLGLEKKGFLQESAQGSNSRNPFKIGQPTWTAAGPTSGTLTVPISCEGDGHLLLSQSLSEKTKGPAVSLGKWRPSKLDYFHMEIIDRTEEVLYTPGSLSFPLTWVGETSKDPQPFEMSLTITGCTDGPGGLCYPPDSYAISGNLIEKAGRLDLQQIKTSWSDPFSDPPPAVIAPKSSQGTGLFTDKGLKDTGLIERAREKSLLIVFILAFIGGILTSFTPCVYPMIPATVAIFGAKEVKSRLMACSLAATYIMGVALSYAALGVTAAAIGVVFSQAMENPWVISVVAAFYVFLALAMLDVFTFYLPSSWVTAATKVNRKGYVGAFLMGVVSSVVFAPCGEPILLGLLGMIAQRGDFFLGFWLLFVYAWGIGVLFFVIATFAGTIQYLPKAGVWMVAVKDLFGLLLFGLALFWLQWVLPEAWLWGLLTIYFLGVATFIHTRNQASKGWSRGILSLATMASLLVATLPLQRFAITQGWLPHGAGVSVGDSASTKGGINWVEKSPMTALDKARREGTPVVIDYRMNVCALCDELEHNVFADPDVQAELARFVTIKVNISDRWNDLEIDQLAKKQGVFAVPVVEFVDSKGKFLEDKKFAHVVTPEWFLNHIKDIR